MIVDCELRGSELSNRGIRLTPMIFSGEAFAGSPVSYFPEGVADTIYEA